MMLKRSLRTFEIMTWVLVELFTFPCLADCVFLFLMCHDFLIICFIVLQPRIVDWKAEDLYRVVFNRNNHLMVTELPKELQALAPGA